MVTLRGLTRGCVPVCMPLAQVPKQFSQPLRYWEAIAVLPNSLVCLALPPAMEAFIKTCTRACGGIQCTGSTKITCVG